jgi:hypothetical protein
MLYYILILYFKLGYILSFWRNNEAKMPKKYPEEIEKMQIITTISPMTTKVELPESQDKSAGETPMPEDLYAGKINLAGLQSQNTLEAMQKQQW